MYYYDRMNLTLDAKNPEATKAAGEKIGHRLKGGETIELISDLGGGKTTLTKGLARGIGSNDHVASPTFTISRLYRGKKLDMHHFDFYRLNEAGLMEHEIADVLGDPSAVVVVEWGDAVAHVLPKQRLTIRLAQNGEDSRTLHVSCPAGLDYLVEDIA